ncbi:ABC transporter permease [Rudaeicoccus suwonensis]|uniref:Transport permease protein n=1 Tax=Rudaeicoccus suwonensis TaxID=657409 RepID=A0A561EBV9_9MICO|nr:ABC transporter permease [Rudaeicoccus suwonensis]TWE13091.1 lipooligosaccharide transport system permease protein [Rudaeicoccus suwonensis]
MSGSTTVPAPQPLDRGSGPRMTWRLLDYWATVYKRTWRGSIINSFVSPILYVVAMGVLLGGFVKADPAKLDGAHSYLAFVVPGMLSAQTMQVAIGETTYPVMGGIKWHKSYFAMLATPLRVADIVLANLGFAIFRIGSSAAVFVLVMAPFGVFTSVPGALAAFVIQLLLGLAFAAPIFAYSSVLKDEGGFSIIYRLLMIPLFLFSGAFFPLSNLPAPLEAIAVCSPLWQGVDLARMATLGTWHAGTALVHIVYLVVLAALGTWLAIRGLTRRMVK